MKGQCGENCAALVGILTGSSAVQSGVARILRGTTGIRYAWFSGGPPSHANGDLTSLAPQEKLHEILVVKTERGTSLETL